MQSVSIYLAQLVRIVGLRPMAVLDQRGSCIAAQPGAQVSTEKTTRCFCHNWIAQTLDGYVAADDMGFEFLHAFDGADYGYESFLRGINVLVVGRTTYDQICRLESRWPYEGRTTFVVTHRDFVPDPAGPAVISWTQGIDELLAALDANATDAPNVWVIGGPAVLAQFAERDRIDQHSIFVMPVLLGSGIRLFPRGGATPGISFLSSRTFPNGVVELSFKRTKTADV